MNTQPALAGGAVTAAPRLAYFHSTAEAPPSLLGGLQYGAPEAGADPAAWLSVPLAVVGGTRACEAWLTEGPVTAGERGGVRFRASRSHLFAWLEVDEAAHGGPEGAAREAYRRLVQFHAGGAFPYPWRIWNFLDAINEGTGDNERYRLFCRGRAEGLGTHLAGYPAGSALGRRDGRRVLQVAWLGGNTPGQSVENPRQVSAFRYPRQYGPASPSFARAMRLGPSLLISGTASIVGHETVHRGELEAQAAESVANLRAVAAAAALPAPVLRGVKAYVRHAADVPVVAARLTELCAPELPACLLLADICREDLLLELEAVCQD